MPTFIKTNLVKPIKANTIMHPSCAKGKPAPRSKQTTPQRTMAQMSLTTMPRGTMAQRSSKPCQNEHRHKGLFLINVLCSKLYLFQFHAQCFKQQCFLKLVSNPIYHFLNHSFALFKSQQQQLIRLLKSTFKSFFLSNLSTHQNH
jgi:hypothetical protein